MSILKNRGVQVAGVVALALLLTGAVVDRRVNYWGKSSTAAPALLGSNYSTGPGVTAENTSSGYGVQALSTSGVPMRAERDGSSGSTVPVVGEFANLPTSTTSNGTGVAVNFKGQMANGTEVGIGGVNAVLDDVSAQKGHVAIMVSDASGAREVATVHGERHRRNRDAPDLAGVLVDERADRRARPDLCADEGRPQADDLPGRDVRLAGDA